uniref:Uncharacterized protein n=1 Tax=Myotis myotis TaxID=51298 RepID=A0A7J7QT75_MYOMY|nr:hypothetical protein mMyoMyo1_011834 [Myotis myotis]
MTWSGVAARRERSPGLLVSAGAGRGSQTLSGVTSRLTCLFSCRTSLAGALGAQRPAGLCPLLSGGAHTTLASGPQNPQDDKVSTPAPHPPHGRWHRARAGTHSVPPPLQKWCYPAHAWASDPGLLQVLLALTQEYAALGTTNHPSQESAAKVSVGARSGGIALPAWPHPQPCLSVDR